MAKSPPELERVCQRLEAAHLLPLHLGSSSGARRGVLTRAGLPFLTLHPDIDERAVGVRERTITHDAEGLVLRVAHAKADALLQARRGADPLDALLITCDQVVRYDGTTIREKPASREQGAAYLRSYGPGHPAETVSGVVVTHTQSGRRVEGVDVARQHFTPMPEEVITRLLDQGDVMYCCGGFMIDDPAVQPYLREREGSEDSILGMPMGLLVRLLQEQLAAL